VQCNDPEGGLLQYEGSIAASVYRLYPALDLSVAAREVRPAPYEGPLGTSLCSGSNKTAWRPGMLLWRGQLRPVLAPLWSHFGRSAPRPGQLFGRLERPAPLIRMPLRAISSRCSRGAAPRRHAQRGRCRQSGADIQARALAIPGSPQRPRMTIAIACWKTWWSSPGSGR
jgi:hypothetical protein